MAFLDINENGEVKLEELNIIILFYIYSLVYSSILQKRGLYSKFVAMEYKRQKTGLG